MVSSEQIKRKFLDYKGGSNRKKRCGCIETKILTFGSAIWIQDTELMCSKHWQLHRIEFSKQSDSRIDLEKSSKNNKRKKKLKKDDNETES